MSKSNPEKHLHMVVCRNKRQAKILYDRLYTYWKSRCSGRTPLHANPEIFAIYDPMDAVIFVPERWMFDVTSRQYRTRAQLYNGSYVDKWLDGEENNDE